MTNGGIAGITKWSEVAETLDLIDVFRNPYPKTKSFTFLSAAHRMQTRINRIYSSQSGLPYANACRHVPVPHNISDHQAGVETTLCAVNAVRRGPSF
jgi:hypothetical protein